MALSHSFMLALLGLLYQFAQCVPQDSNVGIASITAPPALLASVQPTLGGGPGQPSASCGGCILVADVAGLIWYSEIFINTAATAMVSIGVGNGTQPRATRTSIIQNEAHFTFNPADAEGTAPAALTSVQFESSIILSGATLTSPTAYNVFTAFTITSATFSEGVCITTSDVSTLSIAYSEVLPTISGKVYVNQAGEDAFINFLGFTTCSNGGASVAATVLAQVSNLTATTTNFYSGGALAAVTTLAPTTNPTVRAPFRTTTLTDVLTTLTATLSGSSTISAAPASAEIPDIVLGSSTLTPNPTPGLPFLPINTTLPTPTGSGTAVGTIGGTPTLVPYTGDAPSWKNDVSLMGSALMAFLLATGWFL